MILDQDMKQQTKTYLDLMEGEVVLTVSAGEDALSKKMLELAHELRELSPKIHFEEKKLARTPSMQLSRPGETHGVVFAGLPMSQEYSSFILALLQTSGRPPKVEPHLIERIQQLEGTYRFETYVSLSCHNCPDVVQALNMMSILNPRVSHTMIDGAAFKEEVEAKGVMAVPAVFLNGEMFLSGRTTIEEILEKLGQKADPSFLSEKGLFDVLVIGGGPSGASAAIYAARKGIKTGVVADRFGGQVQDTLTIENFISVKSTEGPKLAAMLEEHVRAYEVDIMAPYRVHSLTRQEEEGLIDVTLENGATLKSKTVIIATGARWRELGVPGEAQFKNKGVAYCAHCDGPLFTGKDVAVIGGGNSGIEAAIDLAGLARHVTVLEFLPELKADTILQERLAKQSNVTVLTNVATQSIDGDDRVQGLTYMERDTGTVKKLNVDGVFVQIGLMPNTEWLEGTVERNRFGEIVVDAYGKTSLAGVFAAGDCTNIPYKQIITSMGSGATAALAAFDYLIRL